MRRNTLRLLTPYDSRSTVIANTLVGRLSEA